MSTGEHVSETRLEINQSSLERYLGKENVGIHLPLQIKQFTFGQSNPTYMLIDSNNDRFVLRKKPPGELMTKSAHQVEREYRVIASLQSTRIPVPKVYTLCTDESVLGTPFYIMEFLDGRIFHKPFIPELPPKERRQAWTNAIQMLARLHLVDIDAVKLSDFGRRGDFFKRQLRTWKRIHDVQAEAKDVETGIAVGTIPHIDQILRWFEENLPVDRISIVHGDYKIDNMVFNSTSTTVIGILDWELSTIGHPLADLVNLLSPYRVKKADSKQTGTGGGFVGLEKSQLEGVPTLQEAIDIYANETGWNFTKEWKFAEAFSIWREAIVAQGIAGRYAKRQATSPFAKAYGAQFPNMAEACYKRIQEIQKSSKI